MIEGIVRDAALQIEAVISEKTQSALRALLAPHSPLKAPKKKAPKFDTARSDVNLLRKPKGKMVSTGKRGGPAYPEAKRLKAVAAAAKLGVSEAARRAGVSPGSVTNWIEKYGEGGKKLNGASANAKASAL